MHNFENIIVERYHKNTVKVYNPTDYPLIGQGAQGAVFRLSSNQCVKIYVSEEYTSREYSAYSAANSSQMVPKIYKFGKNYIVMEYIDSPSLYEYLKEKKIISESETEKILLAIKEMKRLEFTRIDSALRHIFITKQDKVKIIDLMHAYKIRQSIPKSLFCDLKKLKLLDSFLDQVKKLDMEAYAEWKEYLDEKSKRVTEDKENAELQ